MTNVFGFKVLPLNTWLCIPIYIGGYSLKNSIMTFSSSGLAFSLIFNVLGQQMEISWTIGKIIHDTY